MRVKRRLRKGEDQKVRRRLMGEGDTTSALTAQSHAVFIVTCMHCIHIAPQLRPWSACGPFEQLNTTGLHGQTSHASPSITGFSAGLK